MFMYQYRYQYRISDTSPVFTWNLIDTKIPPYGPPLAERGRRSHTQEQVNLIKRFSL